MDKLRRYRPTYSWAVAKVGGDIPWEVMGGIHKRESELDRKPAWIGGAFKMDMGGGSSATEFQRRLRDEERRVARKYGYRVGARVQDDFRFAALCAAEHLKAKLRGNLVGLWGLRRDVLADAVWGYNGRVGGSWRRSAYVMNDPRRGVCLEMRWRHDRERVYYVRDTRPGVMVLFREIESSTVFN